MTIITRKRGSSPPQIRVGIDLVTVSDVEASIAEFGERYLTRVYTQRELARCVGAGSAFEGSKLAARFAAKEATIKALRPSEGVTYTDIEIVNGNDGSPIVLLNGSIAQTARSRGLTSSSVSLTHDGPLASAVFVALLTRSEGLTRSEASHDHKTETLTRGA
jgi:holo-[acyl-carrier protein] synthase